VSRLCFTIRDLLRLTLVVALAAACGLSDGCVPIRRRLKDNLRTVSRSADLDQFFLGS